MNAFKCQITVLKFQTNRTTTRFRVWAQTWLSTALERTIIGFPDWLKVESEGNIYKKKLFQKWHATKWNRTKILGKKIRKIFCFLLLHSFHPRNLHCACFKNPSDIFYELLSEWNDHQPNLGEIGLDSHHDCYHGSNCEETVW
jgi:hypothetical protein